MRVKHEANNCDTIKASIMSQCPEVCTGVGTMKNHKVKLHIDNSIPPVAELARPIPFHLRERFLKEIQTVKEQNISEEMRAQPLIL